MDNYHIHNFNILLNTDINQLQNQCMINKDTYNICHTPFFWKSYFNHYGLFFNLEDEYYPNSIKDWIYYYNYIKGLYKRANTILLVQRVEHYKHFIIIPTHINVIQNNIDFDEFMPFQNEMNKYLHDIEDQLIDKELTSTNIYILGFDDNHYKVEYRIEYNNQIFPMILKMNRHHVLTLISQSLYYNLYVNDENNQGYELNNSNTPYLRRVIIETINLLKY